MNCGLLATLREVLLYCQLSRLHRVVCVAECVQVAGECGCQHLHCHVQLGVLAQHATILPTHHTTNTTQPGTAAVNPSPTHTMTGGCSAYDRLHCTYHQLTLLGRHEQCMPVVLAGESGDSVLEGGGGGSERG